MGSISVIRALIIGVWVASIMGRFLLGGATLTMRFSPMMSGLVCGLVFGRVEEAMIITAAIQLIFMGVFAPGGQMPSEPCVATSIAVPVALLGNLTPEAAIGVAVPVGLLGSYLYQFRFFLNTIVMQKMADKYAAQGNEKMLSFSIIGMPIIISCLVFIPFMFVALYFGAPIIASVVKSASGTIVFHILEVIGGGLAAIGIAVTVYVIGKKNYIVFFLLAYFMAIILKSLGVTMITYAIVGTIIAIIYVMTKSETISKIQTIGFASNSNDDDDDY